MSNFVLEFPLKTELWQADIIDRRLEAGRKIYNALVGKSLKRYKELKRTKKYRTLQANLEKNINDKEAWRELNSLYKENGLTEYGLSNMVTPLRQFFKKKIGAHIAQTISKRVWCSFEKMLYGSGKKVYFKKYGSLNSLEGKTNQSGLIFKGNVLKWAGIKIPVSIDENNPYEVEALTYPIAYCRIVRRYVRGKRKYYLQIIFKGDKPPKRRKLDGSFTLTLGSGDVGIDIGTSTVAWSSESSVRIIELADKSQGHERVKNLLQRKLDRSSRATNPNNFNEDGTVKKGSTRWVRSTRYLKTLLKLKEVQRKQAAVRKLQHELLANELLKLGNSFYVETMNFRALQRRAKTTEKNSKGRYKRKKRFGKSIANRAPAMFLEILKRKLHYFGKELMQVQRDMYSAFLIMNINSDLKTFNLEKCNTRFTNFLELHNKEVQRLLGNKNLSSIGI